MCDDKTVQRHNSRTITPSLTMLLFGETSCGKYHRHKRNKFKIQTDKSDSDTRDTVPSSLSVRTKKQPSSSQPVTFNRYRSFIKTPYPTTTTWHSLCCAVVCILLAMLTIQTECANALLMDSSAINGDGDVNFGVSGNGGAGSSGGSGNFGGFNLDKIGNLEKSIAAVFNKVAYGSTTTKRSIPDNVFVPSLTTVPTPPLTTYRYVKCVLCGTDYAILTPPSIEIQLIFCSNFCCRYRDREKESQDDKNHQQQQINLYHRNYEFDLERDHALPTSAPNADILKSNSNPTYPNPNRHHNHDRHRHINSTPAPSGKTLCELHIGML